MNVGSRFRRIARHLPGMIRWILRPRSLVTVSKASIKAALAYYLADGLPRWSREEAVPPFSKEILVGMVGAGQFAERHLEVLEALDGVRLEALVSTGSQRSRRVAERYGIERVYSDLGALLSDGGFDALFVVVPILQLKDVVLRCLTSGKPVLMEKPAGVSSSDAEELREMADVNDTFLMVGFNRRFYSVVEHGMAALAAFGPIRGGVLEVPERITEKRLTGHHGQAVYDRWMFAQSAHAVDLFRHLLGPVVEVRRVSEPRTEQGFCGGSWATSIAFQHGVFGSHLALWDSHSGWRMRIVAERASLVFSPLEAAWLVDHRDQRLPIPRDPVDLRFRQGLFAQDLHFLRAVDEGQQPTFPACTISDAVETNRLIEAIYE